MTGWKRPLRTTTNQLSKTHKPFEETFGGDKLDDAFCEAFFEAFFEDLLTFEDEDFFGEADLVASEDELSEAL